VRELAGEECSRAHLHRGVAETCQRAGLDLADPLPAEVDQLADLVGGAGLATVEPEAQREDVALTLVEHREELLDLGREHGPGGRLVGRLGPAVFHQVTELGLTVFADGRLERHRLGEVRDELLHALGCEVELGDLVGDPNAESPVDAAIRASLPAEVERMFALLDERERRVLSLRYGLDRGEPRTPEEVGQLVNLSRERIRQIEARALSRLRHPSADVGARDLLAG